MLICFVNVLQMAIIDLQAQFFFGMILIKVCFEYFLIFDFFKNIIEVFMLS